MDVQKIPNAPFHIFRHYTTYRRLQKKIRKIFTSAGTVEGNT